jgi:hypothetical protein
LIFYGFKIFFGSHNWKKNIKNFLIFILSSGISFIGLVFVESKTGHSDQLLWLIGNIFQTGKELAANNSKELVSNKGGWFSIGYFLNNFKAYFSALRGGSIRFVWDFRPIFSVWLGNIGLLGLLVAFLSKKLRFVSLTLLVLLFGEIIAISLFYAQDARFIIYAIPVILLGFTFFLEILEKILIKSKIKKFFPLLIILILSFYCWENILRVKSQIVINLKYAEVPWSYVSVLKMNEYFQADKIVNGKKPFVISPMVPHYIDFYSNGNYNLLPLSDQQAFFKKEAKAVWGDYDYANLLNLYEKLLKEGNNLYFARYGLGNENYLHAEWNKIANNFKIIKVFEGCYTQCDIFKIELKK